VKAALGIAALVVAGLACLVDRTSEEFACDDDSDCTKFMDGRVCTNNFCVQAECPDECDSCSVTNKTCTINCSNTSNCDNIDCPNGYVCMISCSRSCTNVDCSDATACIVLCSGNASVNCGPIDCGTGVTCMCTATGSATCL
jgi:hypothetical protein